VKQQCEIYLGLLRKLLSCDKKALGMYIGYDSTRMESTHRGDIAWMQIVSDSKNLKKNT